MNWSLKQEMTEKKGGVLLSIRYQLFFPKAPILCSKVNRLRFSIIFHAPVPWHPLQTACQPGKLLSILWDSTVTSSRQPMSPLLPQANGALTFCDYMVSNPHFLSVTCSEWHMPGKWMAHDLLLSDSALLVCASQWWAPPLVDQSLFSQFSWPV